MYNSTRVVGTNLSEQLFDMIVAIMLKWECVELRDRRLWSQF